MNSLKPVKIFVCAILATLGTASAAPPNWDPNAADTVPFGSVNLSTAQSVLYLDDACQVIAFVVPDSSDLAAYLPNLLQVQKRWWEREVMYRHPAKDPCPSKSPFLDAELVTGTGGNRAVCQPNELVTAADLVGAACKVRHDGITSVVVLDPFHEPLLIIEGKLAYLTAKDVVPAASLGRAKFMGGAPCSPTVPSPCYPPKQGVLKYINGQQVCVCQ